jgi:hypothetical protein
VEVCLFLHREWDEPMNFQALVARRQFLGRRMAGPGLAALAGLLGTGIEASTIGGLAGLPHVMPKARRVIWLTQAGAPSQLDLFDYKPGLAQQFNQDLPASVRGGQRLTGMTAVPAAISGMSFGLPVFSAR